MAAGQNQTDLAKKLKGLLGGHILASFSLELIFGGGSVEVWSVGADWSERLCASASICREKFVLY